MKFIDTAILEVNAGDGGNGCVSFRREKFIPKGGPDGGDGGKGGDVILLSDEGMTTLLDVKLRKHVLARHGGHGLGSQMNGRKGADAVIKVPAGTIIKNSETGEILADLKKHNETFVVAKGGRGGRGNMNFKSSTNQAPRRAEKGGRGEKLKILLELKLLADVGLVGLPNAGKSTLISAISNARPKTAPYPFTTKVPSLGLVSYKGKKFTVADIPGLIEGAHKGSGLGISFLKHIERTRVIIHLIDPTNSICPASDVAYRTIRKELESYGAELAKLPEIVALTKMDMEENKISAKEIKFKKKAVPISAVAKSGLNMLLNEVIKLL